jgi:microcystin-dependent protein
MFNADGSLSQEFQSEAAQFSTPTGAYMGFATLNVGDGWLLCDGREVSRTTYAGLFAAIGTVHGAGDGTTTFNLPDARGRSLIGSGTGGSLAVFRDINSPYTGEETHTQSISEMPVHSHTLTIPGSKTGENGTGVANHWRQVDPTGTTDPAGSGTPFNVTHACLVCHIHIKT